MNETQRPAHARDHFVGEVDAQIIGHHHYPAEIAPGEHLNLEREPANPHDKNAIRVENGRCQMVGYLPRSMANWLAPLIDSGKIRIECYLPANPPSPRSAVAENLPASLMVHLTDSGRSILELSGSQDNLHALHELALQAYRKAQSFADPEVLLDYAASLEPLSREDLLPETRLVLALITGMVREIRAVKTMQALSTFHAVIDQLTVSEPILQEGLTLYPLCWPTDGDSPYLLLSRAIELNLAVVEEVSEAGSVPNLRLLNKSLRPLLIPEGEILVGAKQNRVVNVTVLVAAKSTFTLPVSCVEQGRWRYRNRSFRSEHCAPPSLRAKKLRSVQRNRRHHGEAASDQHAVWQEVSRSLEAVDVRSKTASLTDGLAAAAAQREMIALPPNTAGIAVGCGGQVIGLDLFDSPETFRLQWERLAQAYFFDALQRARVRDSTPSSLSVREFLGSATNRARAHSPALGLGEELEISGDGLVGTALLYGGRLCHLAVFRETGERP